MNVTRAHLGRLFQLDYDQPQDGLSAGMVGTLVNWGTGTKMTGALLYLEFPVGISKRISAHVFAARCTLLGPAPTPQLQPMEGFRLGPGQIRLGKLVQDFEAGQVFIKPSAPWNYGRRGPGHLPEGGKQC